MASSSTNSTTKQHQETSTAQRSITNQRTDGGSLSLARTAQTGGSTHNDQSTSINQQYQRGVNTSVTGATGKVNDRTQAAYDKVMDSYTPSATVQAAYNKLQETLNNKPGAFSSKYTANLENLYGQIMNRPGFSYNMNNDAMYNIYKDLYQQQGKSAMRDTVAQSAALTGGYNNSYATTAGSQAYQTYLERLNEMVPQLQQNAYNMYQDETNNMYNKANLTQNLYQQDYGQYRDSVSDWQKDRDYASNFYNNERNFDYNKYNNDRSFTAQEYWNQRNAERTTTGSNESWSLGRNDTTSTGTTNNWSNSETQQQTANWSQSSGTTDSLLHSIMDSNANASSNSVSEGSGGSSGGSRSSSGSKKNSDDSETTEEPKRQHTMNTSDNIHIKNSLRRAKSEEEFMTKLQNLAKQGDVNEGDYIYILNNKDSYKGNW